MGQTLLAGALGFSDIVQRARYAAPPAMASSAARARPS